MTTWTLDQVRQAKGLYVRIVVDVSRHPDDLATMRQAVASKMARALVSEAHAFAIELHPEDLEVGWEADEDRPWSEVGVMRWRPSTNEVEMRGGEVDGTRLVIQNVGDPVQIATPEPIDWSAPPGDPMPLKPPTTYELAGWREDERVWVYESK